jgi:hypothetical protein
MEARRFPRRPFKYLTGCLFYGKYFITQAIELGEGGISLLAGAMSLKAGDEVVLTFKLPKSSIVVQRGVVVGVRQHEGQTVYGFSFLDISFEQKRDIRTFVSTH